MIGIIQMKKPLIYFGLFLCITFILGSVYCLHLIYSARKYTHEIISIDIERAQWRYPNGKIQKFDIFSHELSRRQKKILIKVQDPGFYQHNGIDLSTPGAGLTTITQAIVKKLYFEHFTPGIAKVKKSLIARFVVDGLISKDDQLTLFINTMYFGKVGEKPVAGIKSAAAAYYRQPVDKLTEDQYISLIAMIVMPGTFHIIDHPDWNGDRTNRIKALIAGNYKPKGLMDQFYGELPETVVKAGLPPASYFPGSLKDRSSLENTPNRVNSDGHKSP